MYIRHFEVVQETGSRWLSSALWDCFGDEFSTGRQICPQNSLTMHLTTISTRSPVQPQSGEYDGVC